jgi:protein SPA2
VKGTLLTDCNNLLTFYFILFYYFIKKDLLATSQLFLQVPKLDDQLPVSADGGLLNIHVTAFVSTINSLLTAGRSHAPTRFLTPVKSVVNAVSMIVKDMRLFERCSQWERSEVVDQDMLKALRERAKATLSNLVTASKTHATSSGMSPISFLSAAASHVSVTVTEIGMTICIRKASRIEQDDFEFGSFE